VLEHLFSEVEARRDLLAEAFDVATETPAETAEGIITAVTKVRDALGLPTRLRDIADMDYDDLPAVATSVAEDGFMDNCPEGYTVDSEAVLEVLERAW
jgi:alcohol dehydrogenase